MSLLEHVISRDKSFCSSDWYLLLADTEAKSWRSFDTSTGSKTSTYFSQVFKIQSQQSLNRLTKNMIEVTGIKVLLSVETMDCRHSSMNRRHVASTFSYTLGTYPVSNTNSSTANSLKRWALCILVQHQSYSVLKSMYKRLEPGVRKPPGVCKDILGVCKIFKKKYKTSCHLIHRSEPH
jgi:hypothetical protein